MDKAIGFSLTKQPFEPEVPPWLSAYPWLNVLHVSKGEWNLTVWGHGDLSKFLTPEGYVVGYSDTELTRLTREPMQNRGVLIKLSPTFSIANDALGQLPVFYSQRDGVPIISSCEECVIKWRGGVTLNRARLVQYLIFQSYVGTVTLWDEIDKLYANRILKLSLDGQYVQMEQEPLRFKYIEAEQAIATISQISKRVIRSYTDPLDDVYLPLSRGKDSGILLGNMVRPGRIHARTMPSSWPLDRCEDVVITRARCRNTGVEDHQIIDFPGQSYQQAYRPQIEYAGTPLASTQAYIFGINQWMGQEGNHWPVISGSCGDITAGSGVARVLEMYNVRQTSNDRERFKLACYCHSKEWKTPAFDACVAFDPASEMNRSGIQAEWSALWRASEGHSVGVNLDLIRLRNRGSQYITYAWAAADLWGSYVAPFTDRAYVTTMLSLPQKAREFCYAQKEYGKKFLPGLLPNGGVHSSAWDVSNTLNNTTVSAEALWPLTADGCRPAHPFFVPAGIQGLYRRALDGDMKSFFWLHSLQPLAYMIDKGYVK